MDRTPEWKAGTQRAPPPGCQEAALEEEGGVLGQGRPRPCTPDPGAGTPRTASPARVGLASSRARPPRAFPPRARLPAAPAGPPLPNVHHAPQHFKMAKVDEVKG